MSSKHKNKSTEICQLFNSGRSLSEINKILSISKSGIYRVLKECNINTKRNNLNFRYKMQKYCINENYFHMINNQEKAYVLGLLYADGNANKKFKQITLKLQEKDKSILEKISLLIETNKPLHFVKKTKSTHQNQYSLKITNRVIYQDLLKHGIVPNKTFITKMPCLDTDLFMHFVRGYFDGDGCIYITKNGKIGCIDIIGSEQLCDDFKKIFEELGVKSFISHDKRCKQGINKLRIRKYKDIIKIYHWMYDKSNIHLERKFDKFIKLMEAHNDKFY